MAGHVTVFVHRDGAETERYAYIYDANGNLVGEKTLWETGSGGNRDGQCRRGYGRGLPGSRAGDRVRLCHPPVHV